MNLVKLITIIKINMLKKYIIKNGEIIFIIIYYHVFYFIILSILFSLIHHMKRKDIYQRNTYNHYYFDLFKLYQTI
jgi:hypothetical protein